MLAYVQGIQRQEIKEMSSVKHQDLAGSTVGDTIKNISQVKMCLKHLVKLILRTVLGVKQSPVVVRPQISHMHPPLYLLIHHNYPPQVYFLK